MVTKLLLVRHGETDAVGSILAGRMPDWHLNDYGRRQVLRLARDLDKLLVDYVYTSPLERAVETASEVGCVRGLQYRVLTDLTEVDFGEWEGLSLEELEVREDWHAYLKSRTSHTPQGGEPLQHVQERMVRAATAVQRDHPGAVIVLVSHADPLRTLIAHYLKLHLDLISTFDISPASLTAIDVTKEAAVVKYMNCGSGRNGL